MKVTSGVRHGLEHGAHAPWLVYSMGPVVDLGYELPGGVWLEVKLDHGLEIEQSDLRSEQHGRGVEPMASALEERSGSGVGPRRPDRPGLDSRVVVGGGEFEVVALELGRAFVQDAVEDREPLTDGHKGRLHVVESQQRCAG